MEYVTESEKIEEACACGTAWSTVEACTCCGKCGSCCDRGARCEQAFRAGLIDSRGAWTQDAIDRGVDRVGTAYRAYLNAHRLDAEAAGARTPDGPDVAT